MFRTTKKPWIDSLSSMSTPAERRDSRRMRAMFGAISSRYDFVTRLFSYGMDHRWKRWGVECSDLPEDALVLDLAAGTGDFSRLVLDRLPRARVLNTVCGDVCTLPFANAAFDGVFVGYGLRNFPVLADALREIARITRPGGRIVSLDFFLPRNACFRLCYLTYLYMQGGFWGLILHGRARTYTYIADSLRHFTSIQGLSAMLVRAGFAQIQTRRFILGGIGLHWAIRQDVTSAPLPVAFHLGPQEFFVPIMSLNRNASSAPSRRGKQQIHS
jgi:demethylmenaquinone methyltransferase/2-methoxy-6-polyprenyl-1,4-benzoquinol methylase